MKFLHSPSSSSSSSTTNYTPLGCIPAVLRRLLCFHTLPTFALDNHIQEACTSNEFDELYCGNKLKGSPGIVGKLMGLDSMPRVENSVNKWRELKLRKKGNYVLEAPAFVEVENDKFIILSFEGGGKDKELKLNSCQLGNLGKNSKKLCENSRNKKFEKAETESDSENSSPVSVLEFSDHQETSCSGKEGLKSKTLNSRRKLRGGLDKNAPSQSPSSCNSVDNGEEYVGLDKKSFVIGESKEMCEEIWEMVERDVMDSSRWKGEDIEEIGVCFELQILDQLILELLTIT